MMEMVISTSSENLNSLLEVDGKSLSLEDHFSNGTSELFVWRKHILRLSLIWLVVYLPLLKMMEFVSWDDDIPN